MIKWDSIRDGGVLIRIEKEIRWRKTGFHFNDSSLVISSNCFVLHSISLYLLISGLKDGSIIIWNPLEKDEEKKKRILPQKHLDPVESLLFSPDGRFLASVDRKGVLIIWSTEVRINYKELKMFLAIELGTGRHGRDVPGSFPIPMGHSPL